ncbi:membrane-spanning 4-domains subfamily A member 12-like [Microcebus murinus]|uniref:membrane-spanning 4-domains subfamily A member 12-like n=1 Tax=Microcebus murinus TaxID=30608 RepID=UPI003F6CB2EC
MPRNRPQLIRKEIRVFGAVQIMTALMVHTLGVLWSYLISLHIMAFGKTYVPFTSTIGYPYWSSWFFTFSGIFAIVVEKSSSSSLMCYTTYLNITSFCVALVGMIAITFELAAQRASRHVPIWPHTAGKLLTEYLGIFTILELFAAFVVVHWVRKARHGG